MRDLARRRRLSPFSFDAAAALVVLALAACGGSGEGPAAPGTPAPGIAPPPALTVTITATGATPRELQVPLGSRVTFMNDDNRSHQMMSDPHPLHTDCEEINAIGTLERGQSRTTAPLTTRKACGFHDNMRDGETSLRGQILVGGAASNPDYRY